MIAIFDKKPLYILYLVFTLGFYNLQLSIDSGLMMKSLLFIGLSIGVYILFAYYKNWKHLFLLLMSVVVTFIMFDGDTRVTTVLITGYLFKDGEVKEYFLPMLVISMVTFMINILIGFGHMNACGLHLGTCILFYICYKESTLSTKNITVLILIMFLGYLYTSSSQFLISISFVLLMVVLLIRKGTSTIIKKILSLKILYFIIPFIGFINYYLPICFTERKLAFIGSYLPEQINTFAINMIYGLDRMMNYRLSLSEVSLRTFGFHWFGGTLNSEVLTANNQYFNLDSGYLQILQTKGLVFFLIFLIVSALIIRYLIKRNEYFLTIITIALAFWGVNEDITLTIRTNFIIIFWFIAVKDYLTTNSFGKYLSKKKTIRKLKDVV